MIAFITTLFFVLGLTIGSFLNVLICRWNTHKSLGGRSACMSCRNPLCWYELIPLVSFFALLGRCRVCKTRISKIYPAVELITALIFTALFLKFQDLFVFDLSSFLVTYSYYAVAFSILVVIAFYDLRHKIIPDTLSLTLGIYSFIGLFLFDQYGFSIHWPGMLEILGGVCVSLPFALFWLVSKGTWMGLGDAKLAIGLGFLLGISRMLSGVVISFWSGAILGIFLVLFSKRHGMKSEIPFAPFLVFGAIIAFIFDIRMFAVF